MEEIDNVTRETTSRTRLDGSTQVLVTTHAYDANNNRTQTTHADGSVTRVEYTDNDQISAEIDALYYGDMIYIHQLLLL